VAWVLGVVGLYGVMAYLVSQPTREIGVRMALGAERQAVSRIVVTDAGTLAGIGIAIGLALAVALATFMRDLLFGTLPWDGATLTSVAVVRGSSAVAASYIPARRATTVNPIDALRSE
jgi:ABC-type antimicrobial peptide transport system permease subunit